MSLLSGIAGPDDLRALPAHALPALADEIRERLVEAVCAVGGHLGPNLGVVELTIALHRTFDSPRDTLLFDTGHQAYVHKMLTGRADAFGGLRQAGGLSGYPSRAESEHDVIENSHASTALSYADGLAKAYALRGEQRSVVAVVGDGALTGGMCWEALNTIADGDRPVVIVVNDNGRSYAPTTGGLARHLAALRLTPRYESALGMVKQTLLRAPVFGPTVYDALHGIKKGVKDMVAPQVMFEDLGLKYVGPVDGHDEGALEAALQAARDFRAPVIVHCVTRKGAGFAPSETDQADRLHTVGVVDPTTGRPHDPSTTRTFTDALGEIMLTAADADPRVVAITGAMLDPVGLRPMAERFGDRVFDVGIAEQHATTSAAGLATGGMRPVVCLYATFLNRAFDQVLMDVALHRLPVVFTLDRAGVTGPDGPSHHGMWDLSWLTIVPGLVVAAPRDEPTLRAAVAAALRRDDGPSVVRFPKGALPQPLPVVGRRGGVDVLRAGPADGVLLVGYGAMVARCLDAADRLVAQGIEATVVDPRYVVPVDPELVELARSARLVVTVEDNLRAGGAGSVLAAALREAAVDTPVRDLGLPKAFLPHGEREPLLASAGLSAQAIARRVAEDVASREVDLAPVEG